MKTFKACIKIFLALCLSKQSYAENREEYIVKQVAKAAAQQAVSHEMHKYISQWINDQILKSIPRLRGKPGAKEPNIGGTVVSTIQIGLSIDNFIKSENGDFKTLAGANVIASIVTLVNPAIGVIMEGILFVVGVFMAAMAFDHQIKMSEILGEMLQEYSLLIKSKMIDAKAEMSRIEVPLTIAMISHLESQAYTDYLNVKCNISTDFPDIELVSTCLAAAESVISLKRIFVAQLMEVVNLDLKYIPIREALDALKYPYERIQTEIAGYNEKLKDAERRIQEYKSSMAHEYLVQTYKNQKGDLSFESTEYEHLFTCKSMIRRSLKDIIKFNYEQPEYKINDKGELENRILIQGESEDFHTCLEKVLSSGSSGEKLVQSYLDQYRLFRKRKEL
ncbi:MAG: hypothetical protein IPJ71_19255 [Bdellovibrionales bacterium]|nr:hypothetical protein [Bdellovibrionales bacterium]